MNRIRKMMNANEPIDAAALLRDLRPVLADHGVALGASAGLNDVIQALAAILQDSNDPPAPNDGDSTTDDGADGTAFAARAKSFSVTLSSGQKGVFTMSARQIENFNRTNAERARKRLRPYSLEIAATALANAVAVNDKFGTTWAKRGLRLLANGGRS